MNTSMEPTPKNAALDDLSKQFAVLQAANHIAHLLGKTNFLEQAIEPLINEFIELVEADCGSIQLLRPGSERTHRTLIRKSKPQEDGFDSHLENLITGWILKHRSPLLTDDIAARCRRPCWKASCLATFVALLPVRIGIAVACSRKPAMALCSSMKLPTPIWKRSRNCCVYFKKEKSAPSAPTNLAKWTSASLPRLPVS